MVDGETMNWNTRRKARKAHRCDECNFHIKPGTVYMSCASVEAEGWQNSKLCLDCHELIAHYWAAHGWWRSYDDGPRWGEVRDWLAGCDCGLVVEQECMGDR
jgi:uncharacterized protein with PIN domain